MDNSEPSPAASAPRPSRLLPWVFAALVVIAALVVAVPHIVIRPFVAQKPGQLQIALWLVRWAPYLSIVTAIAAILIAVALWRRPGRGAARAVRRGALALGAVIALAAPLLTRVNVYERMFHSIRAPSFVSGDTAGLGPNDMVIIVRIGPIAHAFPVRAMTYHHIVNDEISGAPIAVTYCSLCHTGVVWSRVVEGRTLTLHIGGINNQNMLMRDDETGTFWQQSTGVAVAGPLAGAQLARVPSDELTFALFRGESPGGVVLSPVTADADDYAPADWEERMARRPSVLPPQGPFEARELMLTLHAGGVERAYPLAHVLKESAVIDQLGPVQVLLLVGADGRSVRAFDARLPGASSDVELFAKPGHPGAWTDAAGSAWGFNGCATSGPLAGQCLASIPVMRSYWFDWRARHPATSVGSSSRRERGLH